MLVEDDPQTTYIGHEGVEGSGSAYLSIAEADWDDAPGLPEDFRRNVWQTFSGSHHLRWPIHGGTGIRPLEAGFADLIAFGRSFGPA